MPPPTEMEILDSDWNEVEGELGEIAIKRLPLWLAIIGKMTKLQKNA